MKGMGTGRDTEAIRKTRNMEDIDVWRSAALLIRQHGEDAALVAAKRADELLAEGATEGFRSWQRIVATINELERRPQGTICN